MDCVLLAMMCLVLGASARPEPPTDLVPPPGPKPESERAAAVPVAPEAASAAAAAAPDQAAAETNVRREAAAPVAAPSNDSPVSSQADAEVLVGKATSAVSAPYPASRAQEQPGYISASDVVATVPPSQANQYTQLLTPTAIYPNSYSNSYLEQGLEPEVHKHVYVHVAPEEPVEIRAPTIVQQRAPKKHYKIVFIKTPTHATAAPIVSVAPQDQEKTLIYVLSKKPEEQQQVVQALQAHTPPSKPEVFFIRYKGGQEQKQILQNVQNLQNLQVPKLSDSYGVPIRQQQQLPISYSSSTITNQI